MKRAIFVDRDGVLITDKRHLVSMDQVEPMPFSIEAVKELNRLGFQVIGITNQAVVAKGMATIAQVEDADRRVIEIFKAGGADIAKIYYCPHHPQGTVKRFTMICPCRKPAPGMILQGADEFGISLSRSWVVGDQASDIKAGKAAGCSTALIESDYWKRHELDVEPDLLCTGLKDFAERMKSYGNREGLR